MGNSSRSGEHVYSVAQHEVLNEINKDEVLDDVVNFLRRALNLTAGPRGLESHR
jgi:alpha-beta hydrolase superfamily lysophospholipase